MSELSKRPCKYCDMPLVILPRFNKRKQKETFVPCEAEEYMRHGSDPLPKGVYFELDGTSHNEQNAPCGVVLYRSHWADCPGADQARRKSVPDDQRPAESM